METVDCADEESSPLDNRLPDDPLCRSPLRVAPSDGPETVIITRENNSNVSKVFFFLFKK